MRKGQVEVSQVPSNDPKWLEFEGQGVGEFLVPAAMADGIRMHLNDAHEERKARKARKAAKKAERRFYVFHTEGDSLWFVLDRDDAQRAHGTFPHPDCAEADAKAFAKLLNKRNRKPMGGEA